MDDRQNQPGMPGAPRYRQYMQNQPVQPDKRSRAMTTAAVILSVVSISTVCCFSLSIVCAALGIIFALLSKGGEMTMSQNAKTALWVSVSAAGLAVLLLAVSFVTLIVQYGSVEAFWSVYMEMLEAYGLQ